MHGKPRVTFMTEAEARPGPDDLAFRERRLGKFLISMFFLVLVVGFAVGAWMAAGEGGAGAALAAFLALMVVVLIIMFMIASESGPALFISRSRNALTSSSFISKGTDLPKTFPELMAMDVPMCPGITTDTPTCGALIRRSLMSASVKPLTANLAALYAVCGTVGPSDAQKPFTLLVLIMWPSSLLTNIGTKARQP